MAVPAKKQVSLSMVVVVILLLLFLFLFLFCVSASFSVYYARSRSYGSKFQSTRDDDRNQEPMFLAYHDLRGIQDKRKYQTYYVLLREHPSGGEAATDDDKDARRRLYESFLPSTLTDSGEPRLLHCYINGFLARLTRAEATVLAHKPGLRNMFSDDLGGYHYSSPANCGFQTAASTSTKRSFVRSRPAF